MKQSVGILGAGVMGSAFATNIVAAGFDLIGYDPHPPARSRLQAIGAEIGASPLDLAARCSILVTSLPTVDALDAIVNGDGGLRLSPATGRIIIECSTLPIEAKRAARDVLAANGSTLLDCPVSGTGAQAVVRDLVVFASGDARSFETALPVLKSFTRRQTFLGEFGNGTKMKIIANHLVAIHNVAAAEAMVLGMKAGLAPALVFDTIEDSAATSRMFQIRGPMMRDGQYKPATATIRTFLKDISIINAFAQSIDCPLPLFQAAAQPYTAAAAQGRDQEDTASVCGVFESAAGIRR